jgi:hypothetical protein
MPAPESFLDAYTELGLIAERYIAGDVRLEVFRDKFGQFYLYSVISQSEHSPLRETNKYEDLEDMLDICSGIHIWLSEYDRNHRTEEELRTAISRIFDIPTASAHTQVAVVSKFNCSSADCQIRARCANHASADSMTAQHGRMPIIRLWPDGNWYCRQRFEPKTFGPASPTAQIPPGENNAE